jgi:hypothetical protein
MGHSSLDSTMRYAQPSEDDLQNVAERLGKAGWQKDKKALLETAPSLLSETE